MKYPFIGELKSGTGGVVIFASKESAAQLNDCGANWVVSDKYTYHNFWNEDEFKNITAEYLANTYGEVKSKEHAEFIVKLAEVAKCAGLEVAKHKIANVESFKGIFFNFYNDNETLWFAFHYEIQAKNRGEKQITIPLPPECESVDEWPKVGSNVEWGHTGKGEVKSLSDGFAWIKLDNKDYTTVYVSSLRKPKTPEQELRDELSNLAFNQFNDDSYDLTHNSYYLAVQLISKYNITKKPQ